MSETELTDVSAGVRNLIENIRKVIYIDPVKLEYLIAAKIAGGHVILADTHGVGKTSLARALAGSIRWKRQEESAEGIRIEPFSRIQCTVDLLPQDILGYTRLEGSTYNMIFNKGPIFSHFILCDEINLLTPKTQGSFFQAMEEQMVSIEGETYEIPSPFFLIATMNLKGAHLFPLPAPQLDRFMIQLSIGYPVMEDEIAIVEQHNRDNAWAEFGQVLDEEELLRWQAQLDGVFLHPEVLEFIVASVRATRENKEIELGASPRTGVKIARMAKGLALVRGEDFVSPDLIKEIFPTVVAHRLTLHDPDQDKMPVIEEILRTVPVDRHRLRSV